MSIFSDAQASTLASQHNSQPKERAAAGMLRRFAVFLTFFQSVLFLANLFVYETLLVAFAPLTSATTRIVAISLAVLSISFMAASLAGFRRYGPVIRLTYTISAIWLGTFSFIFYASVAWWLCYGAATIANITIASRILGIILFGAALAVSLLGVINANWIRVKRVTVSLANLPQSWRGRSVALVSDLHLGHVRNSGFAARIVRLINRELPSAVIIAGDLFDGTAIDAERATAPFKNLQAIYGAFFSEGNHEEFNDTQAFLSAINKAGVRILNKEKVDLDGLQLLGVPYLDATHDGHLASVLTRMNIDRTRASVLICHAPDRPAVVEQAGILLQLSGHTHGGQFVPYSWIARKIYRQFTHGLSRIGNLQVFTSYGAGTWGPPLRVGTYPEIVVIRME